MHNNEEDKNQIDILRKSSTILDLLNHEVISTIGADRALKRIERVVMQPEVLKTLTFEQLMQYTEKLMKRQKEGREFIIDFYRVTSKSQDIQNVLKQHTMLNTEETKVIEGRVVSSESEKELKNAILAKLDALIREENELENANHD